MELVLRTAPYLPGFPQPPFHDPFYVDQLQQAFDKIPGVESRDLPTIARFFGELNIKAICGDPRRCIVAKYLMETVPPPGTMYWDVGVEEVNLINPDGDLQAARVVSACLPGALKDFIRNFDRKWYPELIDGEAGPYYSWVNDAA